MSITEDREDREATGLAQSQPWGTRMIVTHYSHLDDISVEDREWFVAHPDAEMIDLGVCDDPDYEYELWSYRTRAAVEREDREAWDIEQSFAGYSWLIGWTIRFACPDGQVLSKGTDWLILERHGCDAAAAAMLHLTFRALTDGQSLVVSDMGALGADVEEYTTFRPAMPGE